jgi:hypothetical protein
MRPSRADCRVTPRATWRLGAAAGTQITRRYLSRAPVHERPRSSRRGCGKIVVAAGRLCAFAASSGCAANARLNCCAGDRSGQRSWPNDCSCATASLGSSTFRACSPPTCKGAIPGPKVTTWNAPAFTTACALRSISPSSVWAANTRENACASLSPARASRFACSTSNSLSVNSCSLRKVSPRERWTAPRRTGYQVAQTTRQD